MPQGRNWNRVISLIHWNDRLNPMNHHPYFPYRTTVIWDTTCIRVQKPKDWTYGRHVVNGHYDFPCFGASSSKQELRSLENWCMAAVFAAPLLTMRIYLKILGMNIHNFNGKWTSVMGISQLARRSSLRHKQQEDVFWQLTWNEWSQLVRSRVEHINSVIKITACLKESLFVVGCAT